MAADTDDRTLAELVGGIRIAMLTTSGPEGLQGRPLTVQRVDSEPGLIWFLVGDSADWLTTVDGQVNVAFVDGSTWVSVAGTASTTTDPALIEDLGDPVSDAFFGPDAQPVAVRVAIDHVDWWSSPGKLRQLAGLAKAAITDERPDLGERGEIDEP